MNNKQIALQQALYQFLRTSKEITYNEEVRSTCSVVETFLNMIADAEVEANIEILRPVLPMHPDFVEVFDAVKKDQLPEALQEMQKVFDGEEFKPTVLQMAKIISFWLDSYQNNRNYVPQIRRDNMSGAYLFPDVTEAQRDT